MEKKYIVEEGEPEPLVETQPTVTPDSDSFESINEKLDLILQALGIEEEK